jgi:predicted amidohydrolase YtcJ
MWTLLLPLTLAAKPADLVVVGDVLTPQGPVAGAVVVDDATIRGVEKRAPRKAALVLQADLITAGLVDAHAHPASLGRSLVTLDLVGTTTQDDVLARVSQAASEGTGWLLGRGWDQNDWLVHDWPTAASLDAVTGDRPTVLYRVDGHALWANTAALRTSGVQADWEDPAGGQAIRDETGSPTGVLVDEAMAWIEKPEVPLDEQRRRLLLALEAIAATGLTGVHDQGASDTTLQLYEELAAAGELPVKITAYAWIDTDAAQRARADGGWGTGHFQVRGVKAAADGALGSRGAELSRDYADQPGHRGLPGTETDVLAAWATDLLGHGLQLTVHAIGDAAVDRTLDAFETARAAWPEHQQVPLRVEHAQITDPDDLDRFVTLNAVASMQPTHATSDMPWAGERIGADREDWGYTWRSFLDVGATLAFGSDFPVEAVAPNLGLWSATTRMHLDGTPDGGWFPDQVLTLSEAVGAFSTGAHQARGETGPVGLSPGAPADLTLWRVRERHGHLWLEPTATIVDGVVIWQVDPE